MCRNILELKSIHIAPEKVQTLTDAREVAELSGFELKDEYFYPVYRPEDLLRYIAYYVEDRTYIAQVKVADIKGSLHHAYYGDNWLVMMMNLARHKDDFDVDKVKASIYNTNCFEPIHLRKYEEFYFIDGGGNHRVCQARFLGLDKVPCEVTEYVLSRRFPEVTHLDFSREL